MPVEELPALPTPPHPPWPGETVDVRGWAAYIRSAGTPGGEPALFVHGLGGASTNWTDLMMLLRPHVDGRALDLPGFGRSEPPGDGRYPLGLHVRAVVDVLETWGASPVHLFGNSLGGAVSTRVAAERPDLVRSLTLISPALPDLRPRRGLDWRLPVLFLPGAGPVVQRRLAAQPAEARARATLALVYADPRLVPPERLREAAEEVTRRTGLAHADEAFVRSLRGLVAAQLERGPGSLWQQAASVRAPVLLVWGRRDRLVDVSLAPRAARVFPDAELVVLDDAGHVAQLEQPRAVAAAWLARRAERACDARAQPRARAVTGGGTWTCPASPTPPSECRHC